MEKSPIAFLSYAHKDDQHGRVSELRTRLGSEVEMATGAEFTIFQDRRDIHWGMVWRDRIENSLDGVTFLIPILTPSFFKSEACREEVERFLQRERELGRCDLILPIYYIQADVMDDEALRRSDPLATELYERQYVSWRHLRHKDFENEQVRTELEKLAFQIKAALSRSSQSSPGEIVSKATTPRDSSRQLKVEQKPARAAPEIFVAVGDTGEKTVTVLHGRWPDAGCVFRDNAADETRNSTFPEMVIIGPGEYLMGSDFIEPSLLELSKRSLINEAPVHGVKIGYVLAIARYPVTFEEFDSIAHRTWGLGRPDDNGWGRGRRPVINVTWSQAKYFAERLSLRTGKIYRLPSESEWEYACRAGSIKNGYEDQPNDQEAHFDAMALYRWSREENDDSLSAPKTTVEVGSFPPNAFGLYDMRGNVWEWCEDTYFENYFGAPVDGSARIQDDSKIRVIRGGSWRDSKSYLRSACRHPFDQNEHASDLGFRVVRMIEL